MKSQYGVTWWHGSLSPAKHSFGPEVEVFKGKYDHTHAERMEIWDGKRWALDKQADAFMKERERDLLLLLLLSL